MTAITLSHKIRLVPNRQQEDYFRRACGVARFTYNWALAEWKRQFAAGHKPTGLELKKQFNAIKPVEFPWVYEVTKYASQQPFHHLQNAFARFFRRESRFPTFKKKGVRDRFYIGNDHLKVDGKRIHIPKLGWVRMREALRFSGKIQSATVSRVADRWFVSLHVELDRPPDPCESQAGIGVDLGVRRLATLSNGEMVEGPRPLKKRLGRLRRLQRQLSRKARGSKNRDKARRKVARLHFRIACIRQDGLHKLTTDLTTRFGGIAIEDLHVKDMMRDGKLARAISDMGWYEFRRQLQYKAMLRGNHVEVVDRWTPTSKTCSRCASISHELKRGDKVFRCGQCGLEIDRDLNAARNLFSTVSSTGFQACGENGSGSSIRSSETGLREAGTNA